MPPAAAPQVVAYREVRHFQPDDWLHHETIAVRGRLHDWTIPAHRHQGLHQIHLLASGRVRATIDGTAHRLDAPALWMIAPGTVHGFAYAADSAGQQVTVPTPALAQALAPSPALAARLTRSIILGREAVAPDVDACALLFARIAEEFGQSRPGRAEALAALATLLVVWVLRQGGAADGPLQRQAARDALTHRYRALIELHFRRRHQLAFYADALGVTADHLSRVCRATTGQPALALLHERLLLEARRALAYSGATVEAVARDLGFEDPAYFSRFFGRHAGRPPSRYRAAVGDGRDAPPDGGVDGTAGARRY
ncbi:MAG: helix-turn-helix domain-containing protein [Burkholderiales bacterium]|nr:helix-turn-helix domain-containing protein [Burkholderiales bacterium]